MPDTTFANITPLVRKFIALLITFVLSLGAAEALLRVQQAAGPIVDLEYHAERHLQDFTSHAVAAPPFRVGAEEWPSSGRISDSISAEPCNASGPRLRALLVGDSWGNRDLARGIAEGFAAHDGTPCATVLVAGVPSYSPLYYGLRLAALPVDSALHAVVINVDETDLGNDWFGELFVVRDSNDLPVAAINRMALPFGTAAGLARQNGLYVWRLVRHLYFTRVVIPQFHRILQVANPAFSPDWESIHAVQLMDRDDAHAQARRDRFRRNLSYTIAAARRMAPNAEVVLSHHPHKYGIAELRTTAYFRPVVAEDLAIAAQQAVIASIEAGDSLASIYPEGPEDFFVPGDRYSHLTVDGYERYGRFIARRLIATAFAAHL